MMEWRQKFCQVEAFAIGQGSFIGLDEFLHVGAGKSRSRWHGNPLGQSLAKSVKSAGEKRNSVGGVPGLWGSVGGILPGGISRHFPQRPKRWRNCPGCGDYGNKTRSGELEVGGEIARHRGCAPESIEIGRASCRERVEVERGEGDLMTRG